MDRETVTAYGLAVVGGVGGVWEYGVRPELTAKRAWIALGIGVLAYELACPRGQLMSEGADKVVEKHPWLAPLAAYAIAAHVVNTYEEIGLEAFDPIAAAIKLCKGER